jgi:hypothetical protein
MTRAGKWMRENVWSNPTLMFAMKIFIEQNVYKVLKDASDPQSEKFFIAKHATDHLNGILGEQPELRCNKLYAAEFPISVKIMQKWLNSVFDHHWRRNKKGIANQTHEREDAVQQRVKYVFDNKKRQLQNMVCLASHMP